METFVLETSAVFVERTLSKVREMMTAAEHMRKIMLFGVVEVRLWRGVSTDETVKAESEEDVRLEKDEWVAQL
jgi:hypothetical protein